MKEEEENSIDKLFSQGLSEPGDNASYREEDWDAMEAMLDGKKPKGITRSLIILVSSIAAILLLVIGWLFLNPASHPDKTTQVVKKSSPVQKDSGKYGPPVQQLADLKSNTLSATDSNAVSADVVSRKSKSFFTLSAAVGGRKITGINAYGSKQPATKSPADNFIATGTPGNNIIKPTAKNDTGTDNNNITIANSTNISVDKTVVLANNNTTTDTAATGNKRELVSVMDDVRPNKKPAKRHSASGGSSFAFKPTLALSFIASPDVNSVKGYSQKVGTNAGLLLTVGVTSKWSITTGAIYADKPYLANFANYTTAYKFNTNPESVSASCTVLDIPINLGYRVYNKGANKFSLGTGLSSYFMLRENYTFNYSGNSPGGPATYNIRNKNQHILGILNLNATYQREISSKFGVAVQPYYKIPLTGIGYGQVNLKSAGVAVGVTWNINPGIKP